jgi:patatin-related protein
VRALTSSTPSLAPGERELRIGLVMNGGVSLAIWMGGVTRELDRARLAENGDVYAQLLELTRTHARIDVIAGASAGGINGTAIALAIARGTDTSTLRALWMSDGAIEPLLRNPLEADAPSLLRGDDRFLDCLRQALTGIGDTGGREPPAPADAPVHLSVTGTTLKGQVTGYADHFGSVIPDVDHRALFTFSRAEDASTPRDDFARTTGAPDAAADRLALAGRSSASFPGAFEPSFCPTSDEHADSFHPSMASVASFKDTRWVIDGGVLVNTPFRPALDAIRSLPAEAPVRRVLGYVVPHPVAATIEPDEKDRMPQAVDVISGAVSRLPRVQSIGRELEEIEANNRAVDRRREARVYTLEGLTAKKLRDTAETLRPAYVEMRRASAADDIAMAILDGRRLRTEALARKEVQRGGDGRVDPWRAVPSAHEVARLREEIGRERMPWLPDGRDEAWHWGLAPVEQGANLVLQCLRNPQAPDTAAMRKLRADFHRELRTLRRIQDENAQNWRQDAPYAELLEWWEETFPHRLGALAARFADLLVQLRGNGVDWHPLETLVARDDADETLLRVLALDVVQRSSGADLSGIEQRIDLVLMSGDALNAFRTLRAEQKLAGLQLGHFGAFLKQGWRANDWMWGRLDGADRLVRTLLDPSRVGMRLTDPDDVEMVAHEIGAIACGARDSQVRTLLEREWEEVRDDVVAELEQLRTQPEPVATGLYAAYRAIQRRVQLEILMDEIPLLRDAVIADLDAGAAPRSPSALWAKRVPHEQRISPQRAIDAFMDCPVGCERIDVEVGGDLLTAVATSALAVTGSVVGGAFAKVKPLRPVLATLRGILLALYLLARGLATGSRSSTFAVALALGVGGALVALFLLGVTAPGALVVAGASLVIGGIALGLLRRTWVRVVGVFVVFAAATAGYWLIHKWEQDESWVRAVSSIIAIALMAAAAMALGWPRRVPR